MDQGVLELDEDIHAYLTSWRLPDDDGRRQRVTVRQLPAHTAGLSYNWFRGFHQDNRIPPLHHLGQGRYRVAGLDCEIRQTDRNTVELRQENDSQTAIREPRSR